VNFKDSHSIKIELYSSNVELWNLFYDIIFTADTKDKPGLIHQKVAESFEMSIKKALCYLHNIGELSKEEYHFLLDELDFDVEQSTESKRRRRTPENPKEK
jgi:hypothetical protein